MNAHAMLSAEANRLPVRFPAVLAAMALDRHFEAGTIGVCQQTAAFVYEPFRRRYGRTGSAFASWRQWSGMSNKMLHVLERDHARPIRAVRTRPARRAG